MNTKFLWVALVAIASAPLLACSGRTDVDAGGDVEGPDVVRDAGFEAAADTATDVATDVPIDTDHPQDGTMLDTGTPDVGVDAPADTARVDVGTDTGTDAGTSDAGLAALCTSTGGTITTGLCCASQGDFPNICAIGGCSCSPSSSHTIMKCQCATGACFDSTSGCH